MKLKINDDLRFLANAANSKADLFAHTLSCAVEDYSYMSDDFDLGCKLRDALSDRETDENLMRILEKAGIELPDSEQLEIFKNCIVMGEDDCPECGGIMQEVDYVMENSGGDGYITPDYDYATKVFRRCECCGYEDEVEL